MPYSSDAQRRWAHTATGIKNLGKAKVEEFDEASKGMDLPERVEPKANGRKRLMAAMMKK